MKEWFFLIVFCLALVMPVSAADLSGGDLTDGNAAVSDPAGVTDPTDPTDEPVAQETSQENSEAVAVLAVSSVSDALSGGYYFVCDCALGSDLTFFVPLEWAHDVFTYDSSGAPVNLSNNTCYAYCPDFPDYTFSCSRFGTFTYRASNYNTSDLHITEVTDTNMSFFEGSGTSLSDSDLVMLCCVLIFFVAAILIFKKG